MSDKPALPNASQVVAGAINALVASNPARLAHINGGVGKWANVVAGWKAQCTRELQRVADEMVASRLALATGQALRDLAASEFLTILPPNPTVAVGQIVLARIASPLVTGGVIPVGTRFVRKAQPNAYPVPLKAAEYVSTQVVIVQFADTQAIVPIQATTTGPDANIIIETGVTPNNVSLSTPLFDSTISPVPPGYTVFTPLSCTAAGGALPYTDDDLRLIAGAQPLGSVAPTDGAMLAGALLGTGVRHVAVVDDLVNARTIVFTADPSWGSDSFWQTSIIQSLINTWAGFGCVVVQGTVTNTFLRVYATIQLRDTKYLTNTNDITTNVRKALSAYFNNRSDWYIFKVAAIRAAITRADPRILACTSVTVKDRNENAVAEPSFNPQATSQVHWYLLGDGFLPTYVAPQ